MDAAGALIILLEKNIIQFITLSTGGVRQLYFSSY